jgi:hypothetical protein
VSLLLDGRRASACYGGPDLRAVRSPLATDAALPVASKRSRPPWKTSLRMPREDNRACPRDLTVRAHALVPGDCIGQQLVGDSVAKRSRLGRAENLGDRSFSSENPKLDLVQTHGFYEDKPPLIAVNCNHPTSVRPFNERHVLAAPRQRRLLPDCEPHLACGFAPQKI